MKSFFKIVGATLVALVLFSFVTGFLSVVFLVGLASVSSSETVLNNHTVFRLTLEGELVERSENDEMAALRETLNQSAGVIALDDIRISLEKAARSGKLDALYLDCGMLIASPASIQELRDLILKFKNETRLPVVAYADSYTQGTYWLATVADSLFINPQGHLMLSGVQSSTMFVKSALDKLGVEMQIFKVGTFKSAVEPYILNEMSDANRLQMTRMTDGIWSMMARDIAEARGVSVRQLDSFIDEGGFFKPAEYALELGLIDGLRYRSEFDDEVKDRFDGMRYVTLKQMKTVADNRPYSANKVAVLYATGGIDSNGEGAMRSEKIVKELNRLAENNKVKAVVLRVNSPGGSAYGSEQMWHAAKRLRAKKPLIVSMSDYAASGGYYMSCIADTIVAQPATLTGSIGIFGVFPNIRGITKKIGVNLDGVKTHDFADFGNITRPMTQSERNIMQEYINRGYDTFVARCAEGRQMTTDEIKAVAEGRVWLGCDAKELGLVDELGGLDYAVSVAASAANLTDNYSVAEYPVKKDFITSLMEQVYGEVTLRTLKSHLGEKALWVEEYQRIMSVRGIQAFMPYSVEL